MVIDRCCNLTQYVLQGNLHKSMLPYHLSIKSFREMENKMNQAEAQNADSEIVSYQTKHITKHMTAFLF